MRERSSAARWPISGKERLAGVRDVEMAAKSMPVFGARLRLFTATAHAVGDDRAPLFERLYGLLEQEKPETEQVPIRTNRPDCAIDFTASILDTRVCTQRKPRQIDPKLSNLLIAINTFAQRKEISRIQVGVGKLIRLFWLGWV